MKITNLGCFDNEQGSAVVSGVSVCGATNKAEQPQGAEGSLLGNRGISSHFVELRSLTDYYDNEDIKKTDRLLLELANKGYPIRSLNNLKNCGSVCDYIVSECGCGKKVLPITKHCDLRTCLRCSERRKKRLRRRFLPVMQGFKVNSRDFFYFLTIAPKNYKTFKEGLKHIQDSFSKFRRLKYIDERFKGGLYVIETKYNKLTGWNIHLHALIYGRWIDNKVRKEGKNSKVVELFNKVSGVETNVYITRLNNVAQTLNYLLKYVSVNKGSIEGYKEMADYIYNTRKVKLINVFGSFFSVKFDKEFYYCVECNQQVKFYYDFNYIVLLSTLPR